MKKLTFIFLSLLSVSGYGQESDRLEKERDFYRALAIKEADNFKTRGVVCDDEIVKQIQSGIAFADKSINDSIIEIIYLKTLRFSYDTPFRHPNHTELNKLSSIVGLKDFVTTELATDSPNWKLFSIAAIAYGSNEEITDRLIELATLDSKYCSNVIGAFLAGNLTSSKYEPLVLKAISSDQAMQAFIAARYLEKNPIQSALPSLIKQYQRPSSSLRFESKNNKIDQSDLWRRTIGQAILSYERDELLQQASELHSIAKNVNFGRLSKPVYLKIMKKISDN